MARISLARKTAMAAFALERAFTYTRFRRLFSKNGCPDPREHTRGVIRMCSPEWACHLTHVAGLVDPNPHGYIRPKQKRVRIHRPWDTLDKGNNGRVRIALPAPKLKRDRIKGFEQVKPEALTRADVRKLGGGVRVPRISTPPSTTLRPKAKAYDLQYASYAAVTSSREKKGQHTLA